MIVLGRVTRFLSLPFGFFQWTILDHLVGKKCKRGYWRSLHVSHKENPWLIPPKSFRFSRTVVEEPFLLVHDGRWHRPTATWNFVSHPLSERVASQPRASEAKKTAAGNHRKAVRERSCCCDGGAHHQLCQRTSDKEYHYIDIMSIPGYPRIGTPLI